MKAIAVAVFAMTSSVCFAQEPLVFKGFPIGAPKKAVIAAYPKPLVPCKEDCTWSPFDLCYPDLGQCIKPFRYGGITPSLMTMKFRNDKLVEVRLSFGSMQFEALAAAMTERFGQPTEVKNEAVQNRLGATFDNRILLWTRGDAILRITKRWSTVDDGSMHFVGTQYLKDQADKRAKSSKAHAKDL
jgi:hypothetical protein